MSGRCLDDDDNAFSGGCLEGVWMVSGGCLEGFWSVSEGCI